MQQILLKNLEKPRTSRLNEDMEWLCDSLGFSKGRDVNNTTNRVFCVLIKGFSENKKLTSELISQETEITQPMVNHHLRSLIGSGLLYRQKKIVYLRGGSLKAAVEEMRRDTNRLFDDIIMIAAEIDARLGLKNR